MTDLFDRFLNTFSAKDLGSRVRTTIIVGMVLCAVAAAAGYSLLTRTFTIGVDGTIISSEVDGRGLAALVVSIDRDHIERLPEDGIVSAKLIFADAIPLMIGAEIKSIDPTTGAVSVLLSGDSRNVRIDRGGEIELVVSEKPLWSLLMGTAR